jgi:hypothetical protein
MSDKENLLDTFIEIEPVDNNEFLKIKETLTRIGVASRKSGKEKPTLWQSCHILHKKGRYYIVHFKQLFLLDGRDDRTELTQQDLDRTALIASMLEQWGLVRLKKELPEFDRTVKTVVIPYKEKENWNLQAKYNIGKKVRK